MESTDKVFNFARCAFSIKCEYGKMVENYYNT